MWGAPSRRSLLRLLLGAAFLLLAWVFASAGLGASRGAATAVAYGVMALAASLPGALVLVAGWLPRGRLSPLAGSAPFAVRRDGPADA